MPYRYIIVFKQFLILWLRVKTGSRKILRKIKQEVAQTS